MSTSTSTPTATGAAPHRGPSLRLRAATLEIVRGGDAGRSARVEQSTFVVGSGEGSDLRLADPAVSRQHLRIQLSPEGAQLKDLGSKNGTWIGSTRLGEVSVVADTSMVLGGSTLMLRLDPTPIDLPMSEESSFGAAIGPSAPMRHVFAVLRRAARSNITILLEGESGVGKEVLARAIHEHSPRSTGPFVTVDCGAIPPGLIESELFGHERGAFTGAAQLRTGLFEQAQGGTLFLDEVGELPLELQPKLLRVLEQREVRLVGGSKSKAIDVRIIAATNRRLGESYRRGEFREDLYYRLAVARVVIPPLRDRPDDVLPIARSFLQRVTQKEDVDVPAELAGLLLSYDWPGNVRELRSVIDRHALLQALDPRSLFDSVQVPHGEDPSALEYPAARKRALESFERRYVQRVLERAGGVATRASELAGVSRPTFYRMLDRVRNGPHRGEVEGPTTGSGQMGYRDR